MITYKHEKFIKKAISGIVMQKTNFKFRLLIFDDCSPDSTKAIVDGFLNHKNPNLSIVYSKNKSNLGMFFNGTQALAAPEAKFVAACEGDDYWTDPYKLQKQVDFLERNKQYSAHAGNIIHVNEQDNPLPDTWPDLTTDVIISHKKLGGELKCPTMTLMYRSESLNKRFKIFMASEYPYGDFVLFNLLLLEGEIYVSTQILAAYRHHSTSIFSGNDINTKIKNGLITRELLYKNLKPELNILQRLIFLRNINKFKKKYRQFLH